MNSPHRENYEKWVAYFAWQAGWSLPAPKGALQIGRMARERARHGAPPQDFRKHSKFAAWIAATDRAIESQTIDIPDALVTGAAKIGGHIMLSFVPPWAKAVLAASIAFLGIIDANDVLPTAWDDMLEGAMAVLIALGATPTRQREEVIRSHGGTP